MTGKAKSDEDRKRQAMFKVDAKGEGAKAGNAQAGEGGDGGAAGDDEEPAVHDGFFCNACQTQPIKGMRFKCLEWVFSRVFACRRYILSLTISCLP